MRKAPTKPTPKRRRNWKPAFLRTMSKTGNVRLACETAGVNRQHVYDVRQTDTAFRDGWDRAEQEAMDLLEAAAWQRATKGSLEPIYMKDENGKIKLVTKIARYSDTLLIFLLKSGRPQKYRETIRGEWSGPNGGPIPIKDETPARKKEPIDYDSLSKLAREVFGLSASNGHGEPVHPSDTNGATGSLPVDR